MQDVIIGKNAETVLEFAGEGVRRKVLSYLPELMVVEVHFEKGAVGAVHTHPHTQVTYVQSGEFRFTMDGEEHIVSQGDTLAFKSAVPHGTTCLKQGILIDVFTPMREDFLP